jgi:hypothetical protein
MLEALFQRRRKRWPSDERFPRSEENYGVIMLLFNVTVNCLAEIRSTIISLNC